MGKTSLATALNDHHGWLHYDADLVVLGGYTDDQPITQAGSEPDPATAAARPASHRDAVLRWIQSGDSEPMYRILCEEIERCRRAHAGQSFVVAWAASKRAERDVIRTLIPDSEFVVIDAPAALAAERRIARDEQMAIADYGSVEAYLERCCEAVFGVQLSAEQWRSEIRNAPSQRELVDPEEWRTHAIVLDPSMSKQEVYERACALLNIQP